MFKRVDTMEKTFARIEFRHEYSVSVVEEKRPHCSGEWTVVWASRITSDWKLKQMVVGAYPAVVTAHEALRLVSEEYGFRIDDLNTTTLGLKNQYNAVRNIPDIAVDIEMIVRSVLTADQLFLLTELQSLMSRLTTSQLRLPNGFPKEITAKRDIQKWYQLTHSFRIYHEQLMVTLPADSALSSEVANLERETLWDLECFLEPINDSVTSLAATGSPTLHMALPEWCALLYECQVESDDGPTNDALRTLKTRMGSRMREEQDSVIQIEHKMATVFHPRLHRKLPLICSDAEKLKIYRHIREDCSIGKQDERKTSDTSNHEREPTRKRRHFLCQLEESSAIDDELEEYSRRQFPAHQTRDVLSFWSTTGVSQFPSLSRLARRIFAIPAVVHQCCLDENTATVPIDQLPDALILRASFRNE